MFYHTKKSEPDVSDSDFCIASDAHKPYERTTYMADIKEYMEDHYSFEYSKKLLYDNPKKIFEGKKIIQK